MTEQVKVFKTTAGTPIVPGDMDAAIDYTIHTTGANERAVIKDVEFKCGDTGRKRVTPRLDLDGYTAATGAAGTLSVEGNLIMGPSSTLKVKATPATGYVGDDNYFYGMFFAEGNTGIQYITGDGSTASSLTPIRLNSGNNACDDATGAIVYGTLHGGSASGTRFYYRLYNNTIYKYAESTTGSYVHSWSYGSTGYSLCNDGTYIYRAGNGSQYVIWRTKMSDQSTYTINTQNYYGPRANQGACFHHHKGFCYSRDEGNNTYLDKIDLSNGNVTRTSNSDFNTGSYCDGGFTTTTLDGTDYVVEAGDNYWWYYDIDADTVTRGSGGGTSTSTEYAQGGTEIAPGIGLIFGEQTDRATLIDMNTKTMSTITSSAQHGYTTNYNYGNRFGFAGILGSAVDTSLQDFNYEALVSGVEIT